MVATWTDTTGDWSNAANWSTLTVPNNGGGTTYSVKISAPSSVVTMDVLNDTIDNLTLGSATRLNVDYTITLVSGTSVVESGSSLYNYGGLLGFPGSTTNNAGVHNYSAVITVA